MYLYPLITIFKGQDCSNKALKALHFSIFYQNITLKRNFFFLLIVNLPKVFYFFPNSWLLSFLCSSLLYSSILSELGAKPLVVGLFESSHHCPCLSDWHGCLSSWPAWLL